MKRLLNLCLTLALLGSSGALAQTQADPFVGGNFSVRIPLDGERDLTLIALGAQVGSYELVGPLGLRGRVGLGVSPSVYFDLSGDVLVPFSTGDLVPYGGGGASLVAGGTLRTAFGLHGLVGLEGKLTPGPLGLFGEVQPNLSFPGGAALFSLKLNFGLNYHF